MVARPDQPDAARQPDLRPVDADLFRAVFRRQASTVSVVTAAGAGDSDLPAVGLTATSFTSVSLQPPLVSFCLSRRSSCWPTIERAEHLAVHLLGEGQEEVSRTFATPGVDRLARHGQWHTGPYGVPLLDRALGRLVCRTVQHVPAGDHVVVIAEPLLVGVGAETRPLVYHQGRYTTVAATPGAEAALRTVA